MSLWRWILGQIRLLVDMENAVHWAFAHVHREPGRRWIDSNAALRVNVAQRASALRAVARQGLGHCRIVLQFAGKSGAAGSW